MIFARSCSARARFSHLSGQARRRPTVASRFLEVGGGCRGLVGSRRSDAASATATCRSLDTKPPQPITRPAPCPPRAARPASLSVTEIEHWLRDPYTIYAKHILKLRRLDPVDERLGAADRGSIIHGAIGDFAKTYADTLPDDPYGELLRFGERHFAPLGDFPETRAFWWPRYERIARWFADFETKRRANIAAAHAEIRGELPIATGSRIFHLTGRADRIERLVDGSYAILDFKTGAPPSSKQVQIGVAPQLTLEAAMLRNGGFPGLAPGGSIAELVYVRLNGGSPAGQECIVDFKGRSVDAAADEALERLETLVTRFEDEGMPYRPLILSMWTHRYGTYDDLARVKEWSLSGGAGEDEE